MDKIKFDFPKILFVYDHDFLSPMTPLDPRVKYLAILKQINQIKEKTTHKKLSIHWLVSHSFPSVPFIEAISMLGEERFAKSIQYYKFVDFKTETLFSKRNQLMNLFGHLERQLETIEEDQIQLFILDDLYELSKWNKASNFGPTVFYNTLAQIINDTNCYVICLSKPQITDWVDQFGNRKIRAHHHNIIRRQAISSQMQIKFMWLIRPPLLVKLKTENKKGTDTIVSLTLVPQTNDEFDEIGFNFAEIMDLPQTQVCEVNLGLNENLTFQEKKKEEIINSTIALIQNYQIPVQMEREFHFEEIPDIDEYRIYRNPNLTDKTSAQKQMIMRKSHENSKLVYFVKYSLKLNSMRKLDISYFNNKNKSALKETSLLISEYEVLYLENNETSDHLIDDMLMIYYDLLQLDQNEIFIINEIGNKHKEWIKPFLALFLYEVRNLYKEVKIDVEAILTSAIQDPQIINWLSKYKSSSIYYNKYDSKKAISLAKKLPYTLTIVHPRLGVSYLKLDKMLSDTAEGELEILLTKVEGEQYFLLARISIDSIDPIIFDSMPIETSKFNADTKIFLPTNFSTNITDFIPFDKSNEYSVYEIWKLKLIGSKFSEFKESVDLQNIQDKDWNKPLYLKLYIPGIDVVIKIKEDKGQYNWNILT
ncbi:MAG: hypothetical protein HeimC2_34400 [Candidatus Heimdallarchaeota archaeon LC_2]|nr:MAG: hypothetical protein HeimC2_34400 [Candidatus Heimdallarchaeota archaeon LC_2]